MEKADRAIYTAALLVITLGYFFELMNFGSRGMGFRDQCAIVCLASLSTAVTADSLVVNVSGVQANIGDVRVAIFDSE